MSVEARTLLEKVSAILQAYNHDGSDLQTDYFDVRFYGGADYDHAWQASRREVELAALPPAAGKEAIR